MQSSFAVCVAASNCPMFTLLTEDDGGASPNIYDSVGGLSPRSDYMRLQGRKSAVSATAEACPAYCNVRTRDKTAGDEPADSRTSYYNLKA